MAYAVSTTFVSGWIKHVISVGEWTHPLTQVVLTSYRLYDL
jgi:hypothetical protein